MKSFIKTMLAASALLITAQTSAAITTYSNRTVFTTVTGAGTVETFTNQAYFPITGGVLNSTTVCGSCPPVGSILAGVTYSTEVFSGLGNFFNVDSGGGYTGGFLDSLTGNGDPRRTLTATFNASQNGFGFDTNQLMGAFTVQIFNSSNASLGVFNFTSQSSLTFFGFGSSSADIKSVRIAGTNGAFNFALDNFTFDQRLVGGAVPEPTTWAMMLSGFGLVGGAMRYRRRKGAVSFG